MLDKVEIKKKAREFKANGYWRVVWAYIVIGSIIGAGSSIMTFDSLTGNTEGADRFLFLVLEVVAFLVALFVAPVVKVGEAFYSTKLYHKKCVQIGEVFSVGFNLYGRNLGSMLYRNLFIFLWSLLLVIPGIIKYYSYFLTPYLLMRFKNIGAIEAVRISKKLMSGHKKEIFFLQISFIGWYLLSIITFGLLDSLYANPYYNVANAGFANELIEQARLEGKIKDMEGHIYYE
jgi:uncharacterized membrane protein